MNYAKLEHFYDNFLVIIQFAIDIVNQRAVIHENGRLFLIEELQIHDPLLANQQIIQKVNQKRFGELLPKDTFEANVRKGIDVICHS